MLRRFLAGLVNLFLGSGFIAAGICCVILWWSEDYRQTFLNLLQNRPSILAAAAALFLLIGISLVVKLCLKWRRHRYVISEGSLSVAVEDTVFENYLKTYWKQEFPEGSVSYTIKVKPKKIFIDAELPAAAEEERLSMVEKVENDLTELYQRFLGYTGKVQLTASFEKNILKNEMKDFDAPKAL